MPGIYARAACCGQRKLCTGCLLDASIAASDG
jgi:hypothetical protein